MADFRTFSFRAYFKQMRDGFKEIIDNMRCV